MPTPVPIAMPNTMTALRGPGLLAPSEAIVPDGTTPKGFAELLTALLPQTPQLPGRRAGPAPTGQPASQPADAPAIPTKPKTLATDAAGSRHGKSRPISKDPGLAVESPIDPPVQPTPRLPLPPLSIPRIAADIPASIGPKDAANPVVARAATPRASEPAAVSQPGPETRPGVFALPAPPPEPASAKPHSVPEAPQQTISISDSQPALPAIPAKLPSGDSIPPPAEQLAPVLVSIANTPAGAHHMTLQLRPDALGDLHILIDRTPDAPTQIRIEAERPETLALLQRDNRQLLHALDQAGVPREAMNVTFHAAPAVSAAPPAQDTGQTSQQFLGTGQPQPGFADRHPRHEPLQTAEADSQSAAAIAGAVPEYTSTRAGIDITA